MWQKLKEQIPTILITTMILIGAGYWINQRNLIVQEASRQTELAPLREQNDALKAAAEVNRQQIAAVDQLLKDAIAKRQADLFMTDEEISKLNQEKVEALADAIARRVQPYNAIASTPEEAEKLQREQIDKVSSRMQPENLRPTRQRAGW